MRWLVLTPMLIVLTTEGAMVEDRPIVNQGPGSAYSVGQQGGVTAGTYVNQAPAPELKLLEQKQRKDGDAFVYELLVEVISPYPAASLRMEARAQNLIDGLEMIPQHGGLGLFGHSGKREGMVFSTLQSPRGSIWVRVRTKEQEPIEVTYHLE